MIRTRVSLVGRHAGLLLAAVGCAASYGQASSPPALIRDLTTLLTPESSSEPSRFMEVGDRFVFTVKAGPSGGLDLYGSDGAGAIRLAELVPARALGTIGPEFRVFGAGVEQRLLFTTGVPDDSYYPYVRRELWITDGTPAGTRRLVASQPASPGLPTFSLINNLADVGGGLALFRVWTSETGLELWRTDGTPGGTGPVLDLLPGQAGSAVSGFVRTGETIYFVANGTQDNDTELWRTDAAINSTQTRRVKDINPGNGGSYPNPIGVINGQLVFSAYSPATGTELWRTDGTDAGTVVVKDFAPGATDGNPVMQARFGDTLLLLAESPTRGREFWVSDGTSAGTTPLPEINPGAEGALATPLAQSGSILYFRAAQAATGNEIWRSDGTPGGTRMLADLSASPASASTSIVGANVLADGRVLFGVFRTGSGVNPWLSLFVSDAPGTTLSLVAELTGVEQIAMPHHAPVNGVYLMFTETTVNAQRRLVLLKTDLTPGGTAPVWTAPFASTTSPAAASVQVFPGRGPGGTDLATFVVDAYLGGSGPGTRRMFVTNGSDTGTGELLIAGAPSAASMRAGDELPLRAGDRVVFAAGDGRGIEPWASDGTAAGTGLVANIRPESTQSSRFGPRATLGTKLLVGVGAEAFSGGVDLYATDGTDAGTTRVLTGVDGRSTPVALANGRAVLASQSSLFTTDGTASPVDSGPLFAPGSPEEPYYASAPVGPVFNGRCVYHAVDPLDRSDLWISDGVPGLAGTRPIGDIQIIGDFTAIYDLTVVGAGSGQRVCFVFGGSPARSIWSTDGTTLTQHTNTPGGPASRYPYTLAAFGGNKLAYRDQLDATGDEVFVLDPSSGAGTSLDEVVAPGPTGSSPNIWGDYAGWLVFEASDAAFVRGTYVSDGTIAGSYRVDPDPGPGVSTLLPRRAWNGRIIFTGWTAALGDETYALDPVTRQLTLLGETAVGPVTGYAFTPFGETAHGLVGFGSNPEHGVELWVSDGTTPGTRMLADLWPGPDDGWPRAIAEGGGRVYFTADPGPGGGGPGVYVTDGLSVSRLVGSPVVSESDQPWARAGSTAIFPARDPAHGLELWSWPVPDCRGDFNGSGTVTVQDIFDFLIAYFTQDPRADLDGSGAVGVQDIFEYLMAYFRPCV